jgi:hypothetical protein
MADFGADDSFARAATKMEEHYGIVVPYSAMRTITEKHAEVLIRTINDQGNRLFLQINRNCISFLHFKITQLFL